MNFKINKYRVEGWHKDGYNISITVRCCLGELNDRIKEKGIEEIYRIKQIEMDVIQ